MRFLTLQQAALHCKADSNDTEMLAIYLEAAESECEKLANRKIYNDETERTTAIVTIPATILAAKAAYDAAILSADALADDDSKTFALKIAKTNYDRVKFAQIEMIDSILICDNILSAILLLTGHWYRNREEVIVGQSVAEIPSGVQNIMYKYRRVGDL